MQLGVPRRRLGTATLLACGLFAVSCAESGPGEAIRLAPMATSRSPLSRNVRVALVNQTTACVIESFEHRIHCTDRNDAPLGVFGREGEGPGEFRMPTRLIRGPDQTIGVIDPRLARMTVFEPTGARVGEVRLPGSVFVDAARSFSSTLIGRYMGESQSRQVEVDVASGEVLWERVYPSDLRVASGCEPSAGIEGIVGGIASPGGGMMFVGCRGHLIFYEHRDDEFGTLVQAPTYVPELPSQRDVDEYAALTTGSIMTFGPSVEEFRLTRKPYSQAWMFDERERLWVLTTRDRDEFSYLDIYVGPEYAGTVRVRDRARGFDVLGSTLAVLVDRPVGPDDPDGFPDRAIDWYDISRIDFGVRGLQQAEP